MIGSIQTNLFGKFNIFKFTINFNETYRFAH